MSERASERSGGHERSKQSGASERVSGASERANRRASGPILLYSWLIWPIVGWLRMMAIRWPKVKQADRQTETPGPCTRQNLDGRGRHWALKISVVTNSCLVGIVVFEGEEGDDDDGGAIDQQTDASPQQPRSQLRGHQTREPVRRRLRQVGADGGPLRLHVHVR